MSTTETTYMSLWTWTLYCGHRLKMSSPYGYALRMDLGEGVYEKISVWLSRFESFFVVREGVSNPHVHMWLSGDKEYAAVRKDIQRSFAGAGNGFYSLKRCDSDYVDYYRYMCKGEEQGSLPDVCFRQGLLFTDEWVQEKHDEYWEFNASIVCARGSAENVVSYVEREAKRLKLDGTNREEVARIYVKHYVEKRKGVNVFHARSVVNTVCAILSVGAFDALVADVATRI